MGPAQALGKATASLRRVRIIELDDAVVLLNGFPALAGASLRVESGEIVLLRGPNGAGKSTLLRLCAGLQRLDRGAGTILGFDLETDRRALRPAVGYVGHATMLYDDLTVSENLHFWAKAARVDAAQAEAARQRLGVADRLLDVKVSGLSSGQRRRVALSVAVARRPRLWLLDEPHASLDAEGREILDDLIVEGAAAGATVLIASHELDHGAALVDRTVVVSGGLVGERRSHAA